MKKRLFLFLLISLATLAIVVLLQRPGDHSTVAQQHAEAPASVAPMQAFTEALEEGSVEDAGRDYVAEFAEWTADYFSTESRETRDAMEIEGAVIAEGRRQQMKELIREDPRAAIAAALPMEVRERLPAGIQSRVERTVSGRGDLNVIGIVPKAERELPERLVLRQFNLGADYYDAYVYGSWLGVRTREDVFMHGIAVDHLFAVEDSLVRILSETEASELVEPAAPCPIDSLSHEGETEQRIVAETGKGFFGFCSHSHVAAFGQEGGTVQPMNDGGGTYGTHGEKSVIVIRVDFAEEQGESVSEMGAYDTMLPVDQFFRQGSYRQFSFRQIHVTAGIPLRMPKPVADYLDPGGEEDEETGELSPPGFLVLLEDALTAAAMNGYVSEYDFVVVAFPEIGFPWAGLGYLGANGAWVQGAFETGVVAHELGHNFGLHHAGYWEPVGPQSAGTYPVENARAIEYGNEFDVMGGARNFPRNHFSGNFKNILGWLPEETVHVVDMDDVSGNYRTYRLDGGAALEAGRKYSLRITTENHGDLPMPPVKDYWVDFRQLYTDSPRAMNGVVVQWGDSPGTQGGSNLLNMNSQLWPSTAPEAPLLLGETFVDMANQVIITPRAQGGSGAHAYVDVVVTRGQLATHIVNPEPAYSVDNPSGEVRLPAAGSVELRASVTASGSPLSSVSFTFDGISLGEANEVEPGIFAMEIPATGWPDGTIEVRSVVVNAAQNSVRSEPVFVSFVEAEIGLSAQPEAVVQGDPMNFTVFRTGGQGPLNPADIFVGGEKVGETGPDMIFSWVSPESGTFSAYAMAEDQDGDLHRSPSIEVRVFATGEFPYDFLATPSTVTLGETVSLTLDPGEEDVSSVEYLIDGDVVGTVGTPFTFSWKPVAAGDYEVRAAVTSGGFTMISPTEIVTVEEAVGGFPFTFTATPSTVTLGDNVALTVDTGGEEISSVEFWVGGRELESIGVAPFFFDWKPSATGTYEARAAVTYDGITVISPVTIVRVVPVMVHKMLTLDWASAVAATDRDLFGGAVGNGRTVFAGANGTILYSDDGDIWNDSSLPISFPVRGVAHGSDRFIAVGDGGRIFVSDDGEIWEQRGSGVTAHIKAVGYLNGIFLAVGDEGVILRSENGLEWEKANSPVATMLAAVGFGFDRWIAVGDSGTIVTSADGVNWEAQPSPTAFHLRGVVFGKGTLVVVGGQQLSLLVSEGIILRSFDGETWEGEGDAWDRMFQGITFDRSAFAAVGLNGALLNSFDGVRWTRYSPEPSTSFFGAVPADEGFLAFGREGGLWHSGAVERRPTTYSHWLALYLNARELEDLNRTVAWGAPEGETANLLRYAFGFDPWEPVGTGNIPEMMKVAVELEERLALTYRLSSSATDLEVIPETSSDFQEWTPWNGVQIIDNIDQGHYHQVTAIGEETDANRQFFRLNVRLVNP